MKPAPTPRLFEIKPIVFSVVLEPSCIARWLTWLIVSAREPQRWAWKRATTSRLFRRRNSMLPKGFFLAGRCPPMSRCCGRQCTAAVFAVCGIQTSRSSVNKDPAGAENVRSETSATQHTGTLWATLSRANLGADQARPGYPPRLLVFPIRSPVPRGIHRL